MNLLSFQKFKNKKISPLGLIKIIIIILVSVYLIGGFEAFYIEHSDDSLYGFGAIQIVNGSYEYTNEFLQNSQYDGFYFGPFVKTIHNTLIPHGAIGIYGLASISYLLGGYYALFYLGPISAILCFIISERIITKLFGAFAGLVVLIFLSMNAHMLFFGELLLTDHIFTLLLILGCFFLIKFLNEKTNTSILLCSSFLTAATFFRYNGVIFLPIEIFIVLGYFLFNYLNNTKEDSKILSLSKINLNLLNQTFKKDIKKILKISLYILGPWSIFFIFLFSYNTYFFGEPFTTYWEQRDNVETENVISSYFMFDSERFESIEWYSSLLLPSHTYTLVKEFSSSLVLLDQFLLSIISFLLLFSALLISLKSKINRIEIIIFIIFIVSLLLFYSSKTVVSSTGAPLRYMLPLFPFSFGILGYFMYRAWTINFQKISVKNFKTFSTSWKGFLIIIFAILLLSSLYYSKPVNELLIKQNFEFKNPQVFADMHPFDKEGLTEKSVILHGLGRIIIWEYHAIPFNPFIKYDKETQLWLDNESKAQPIKVINELLDTGYDLYVFKNKNQGDPSYYRYLEDEHGLILKEHSETFCKLIRIENLSGENNKQIQSDDVCHSFFILK